MNEVNADAVAWLEDPDRLAAERDRVRWAFDGMVVRPMIGLAFQERCGRGCWCKDDPDYVEGPAVRYTLDEPPPRFLPTPANPLDVPVLALAAEHAATVARHRAQLTAARASRPQ